MARPRKRRLRPGRRRTTTEAFAQDTDGSAAADAEETGPLRRCVVTRERLGKERMIRFVLGPERVLVPDIAASLPGRGIWLSARRDVLETARAQGTLAKAFARAARGPVVVPADLTSVLQAALLRRIGELLGLARRAGQAVAGFEKARDWLRSGQAALVIQASDGSPEERRRFLSGAAPSVAVFAPMPAIALGRVFGRDHTVHVAVMRGRLASTLAIEAGRLAGLVETDQDMRNGLLPSGDDATGGDEMNKRAGA